MCGTASAVRAAVIPLLTPRPKFASTLPKRCGVRKLGRCWTTWPVTFPDDDKVQWFANASTTHRSFAERMDKFARNVDDSHAGEVFTPSRMPFWALERSWDYTAPKSVVLIRRMLRRIRHWVRWGVS